MDLDIVPMQCVVVAMDSGQGESFLADESRTYYVLFVLEHKSAGALFETVDARSIKAPCVGVHASDGRLV